MKTLYFCPGACSLAVQIALREAGVPFSTVRVDIFTKQTELGASFAEISPKNYLPALVLDDGRLLTEAAVILSYVADLAPAARLAPPSATFDRVRLAEHLNFIATELHKGIGPLFVPGFDDYKQLVLSRLSERLALVNRSLGEAPYLMGDTFTVADAYLFWIVRTWRYLFRQDVPEGLARHMDRVAARPSAKASLELEGFSSAA